MGKCSFRHIQVAQTKWFNVRRHGEQNVFVNGASTRRSMVVFPGANSN